MVLRFTALVRSVEDWVGIAELGWRKPSFRFLPRDWDWHKKL